MSVLNKNTGKYEPDEKVQCPRCKGVGSIAKESGSCSMCAGIGKVYMSSKSGWYRRLWKKANDSNLY